MAARIFGSGDFTPYLGAGAGVHALNVEKRSDVQFDPNDPYYYYPTEHNESATTLTADVGIGFIMLRTYDFSIIFDLRYHYVFDDFDALGGAGAQATSFMFGVSW